MLGFRETFEAYGADYDTTMARFMGNEKLYIKLLNMLFQDPNLQKLGDSIEAGDLTAAFEAAHTLKGVTANLGLTPFYEAVCVVVEPLRANEQRDYAPMVQAIQAEYRRAEELRRCLEGVE